MTIPLWNQTLAPLKDRTLPIERVSYTQCVYDPDPERDWPQDIYPSQNPAESDMDYWRRREQWFEDTRRVVLPEPNEFIAPETKPMFNLKEKFTEKGLQIIVKLANIQLTPEKPEYAGGTWHVEGQMVRAHKSPMIGGLC